MTPNLKNLKVAELEKYDGSPDGFAIWYSTIRGYIAMKPNTFPTNQARVFCMLSYLDPKSRAEGWGMIKRDEYLDTQWPAYKNFQDLIKAEFQEPMVKGKAMNALETIKQGLQTIDEHNTKFCMLRIKAGATSTDVELFLITAY